MDRDAGVSCASPDTLLDTLWKEMDSAVRIIMRPDFKRDIAGTPDLDETPRAKGIAMGLAIAISIIENPYKRDIDSVRERAAARFYGQEEEEIMTEGNAERASAD